MAARALCDRGFAAGHRPSHGVVTVSSSCSPRPCSLASPSLARADEANGAWQSRSQLVWDQEAQALVRKNFRVWDAHPELDLEFSWEQQAGRTDDLDGTVNGSGRLTWRARERRPTTARPSAATIKARCATAGRTYHRTLSVQSGLSYDGGTGATASWRGAAPSVSSGDELSGATSWRAPHGDGRYAAADGSIFDGAFATAASAPAP